MFSRLFGKKKSKERQEKIETVKNPQYLAVQLCDLLKGEGAELKEDHSVYLPAYELSIRIESQEISENSATLNFYLNCPKWDRQLFECCASPGKDAETAIGLALGSFVFGMFSGVCAMCQGEGKCRVETTFEGKKHHWTVYQSNLIGMGSSPERAPRIWITGVFWFHSCPNIWGIAKFPSLKSSGHPSMAKPWENAVSMI